MIRMKRLFITALLLTLCLLLAGCGLSSKLVGQWEGDGTLTVKGVQAPFDHATGWEFREDGTGTVTTSGGVTAFEYRTTDDTLTLDFGEISHGIGAKVRGDTLIIDAGKTEYRFVRVK